MKRELIDELFERFESACYELGNVECWSARDLQEILHYTEWRNFLKVLDKAKIACETTGEKASDHFVDINKMIAIGKNAERTVDDIALTRYACYLVAQNGDPAKPAVSFAQTYFAVQTRKQEIIEQRLLEIARVTAREKLTQSEKKLSGIIFERGVDDQSFAMIRSKGDQALFGGLSTQTMKKRLGVAPARPLADFLPTLTLKAKDFATELTSHNVVEKDLYGDDCISKEHTDNNTAVRKMLLKRGVKPEELPVEEDVRKLQRKLENEEKKVLKDAKKKRR
jgi:DNA-damage-inducible protein D